MEPQTLGARVADLLVAEGVSKLFSLPEVTFGPVHDALAKRGVPLIAPHHEAVAGFMAEAYSAFTGQIGVVGGACGPGVMNYYMSIANSWTENLPILYLGSERTYIARRSPRHPRFQFLPTTEIVKPITKFATVLEDPMMVDDIFHEAFRQLRLGQPGPVYIGLPFDMLREERDFGPLVSPARYRPASFLDTVAEADVTAVAKLLVTARLPLIIGGAGVRNAHAEGAFREFAETLHCPVILTHGGRGVLPDTHSQVFDLGIEPGRSITRDADVVFVIGSSIGEKLAFGGNPYFYGQKGFPDDFGDLDQQKWIHLDCDARALGRNRPVDVALVGDMRMALPRLVNALRRHAPISAPRQMDEWRSRRRQWFVDLHASATDVSPVHSGRAVIEVQKALPKNVVVINGGGAFGLWV
jgi:acetolactate synthase I/II/III large subunit